MVDLPNWVDLVAAALSSFGAAWLGVKTAITRLEGRVSNVEATLTEMKVTHKEDNAALLVSHQQTRRDFHDLRNEMTPLSVILQMVCSKLDIPWPGGK